jgi:hypothetical protein
MIAVLGHNDHERLEALISKLLVQSSTRASKS